MAEKKEKFSGKAFVKFDDENGNYLWCFFITIEHFYCVETKKFIVKHCENRFFSSFLKKNHRKSINLLGNTIKFSKSPKSDDINWDGLLRPRETQSQINAFLLKSGLLFFIFIGLYVILLFLQKTYGKFEVWAMFLSLIQTIYMFLVPINVCLACKKLALFSKNNENTALLLISTISNAFLGCLLLPGIQILILGDFQKFLKNTAIFSILYNGATVLFEIGSFLFKKPLHRRKILLVSLTNLLILSVFLVSVVPFMLLFSVFSSFLALFLEKVR